MIDADRHALSDAYSLLDDVVGFVSERVLPEGPALTRAMKYCASSTTSVLRRPWLVVTSIGLLSARRRVAHSPKQRAHTSGTGLVELPAG